MNHYGGVGRIGIITGSRGEAELAAAEVERPGIRGLLDILRRTIRVPNRRRKRDLWAVHLLAGAIEDDADTRVDMNRGRMFFV